MEVEFVVDCVRNGMGWNMCGGKKSVDISQNKKMLVDIVVSAKYMAN